MMRRFALTALLALLPLTASADPITLTIPMTADHEIALTTFAQAQADAVTKRNAEAEAWNAANPKQPPRPITPVLTREEWLADQVVGILSQLSTRHRANVLGAAQAAFEGAVGDTKLAVCAALGLTGKLPECP